MFCFSAYFIEYLSKIDPSFFLFLTENKNRMILLKVGKGSTNPDIILVYDRARLQKKLFVQRVRFAKRRTIENQSGFRYSKIIIMY